MTRIKANGGPVAIAVLGLVVASCGSSAKTSAVTAAKTVAGTTSGLQSEAVVHIYFCTSDTCGKEATRAQMSAVSRRASASPLVAKLVFLSKERSTGAHEAEAPGGDSGSAQESVSEPAHGIPKRADDVEKVAALFTADPAVGIFRVDYGR